MKKFDVFVKEIHYAHYEVEAENQAEAKIKLKKGLDEGEIELGELEYSHTADMDEWQVQQIKEISGD